MRTATARNMLAILVTVGAIAVCLVVAEAAWAQSAEWQDEDHVWYVNNCPSLQKVDLPGVLAFFDDYADHKDGVCATYAIYRIQDAKYQPAIPLLITLLSFQRPDLPSEHSSYPPTIPPPNRYPAVDALVSIGDPALPAVLRAIESDSTSVVALQSALEVWRRADKEPRGQFGWLAGLRREQQKATDMDAKRRLDTVIRESEPWWCSTRRPADELRACRQAAETGTLPETPPTTPKP